MIMIRINIIKQMVILIRTFFVVIIQVTTSIAIAYLAKRKKYAIMIDHTLYFYYSSEFHMATSSNLQWQ